MQYQNSLTLENESPTACDQGNGRSFLVSLATAWIQPRRENSVDLRRRLLVESWVKGGGLMLLIVSYEPTLEGHDPR